MFNEGQWITNQTAAPFYARKVIMLPQDKKVRKAEAKVCGLGQFLFWINGKRVSMSELEPGWTDYNKIVEYVAYDVTDFLREGENVLGAEVGNGWYHKMDEHYTFALPSFLPPSPNPYHPYGRSLVLKVKLQIVYNDGSSEEILTDETWKVSVHPVTMSNVYGSETMDGHLLQEGWSRPSFDDAAWAWASIAEADEAPKGIPVLQDHPSAKVIRSYEGYRIGEVNGRIIYDFGQNMSAILEFDILGEEGDVVHIYPAEKLKENGDVDQVAKNWVTVDSCITYVIGQTGVWEHYRMKFTYLAGRYAALEVVKGQNHRESSACVQLKNLVCHAITCAWKTDGSFLCDDERYVKIYYMIEKAVEANMIAGVHTDCPTIERFAWQEPNHLMAPSILFMKDGKKLWKKFLMDMRAGQHTAEDYFYDLDGKKFYPGDGLMPSVCPCYSPNVLPVPGRGSFYDIIPWGSTCILGTYWHYQFYGDIGIVEENFEAGLRYLNHLKTRMTAEGLINHGLGDWGNPKNLLARENIETAFLYADAKTLAYFAELLGKQQQADELNDFKEKVLQNYNQRMLVWNKELGLYCYRAYDHEELIMTQAVEALPLYWGMVPKEHEEDIIKALRYTLEQENAFISGEVGLPYIIQCASRYAMDDLISRFILKEEHPSYYAFILDGETTLGEFWERNPRSHCHDMMGHIVEWYYNGIAGIQCTTPGFETVTIRPYLPETMKQFTCSYQSVRGTISVEVWEAQEKLYVRIKAPASVQVLFDDTKLKQRCAVIIRQSD